MPEAAFSVIPFTDAAFFAALSNRRFTQVDCERHRRAKYLRDYLRDLKVQAMIVEPNYIDGDYLDDFAAYYVKCFQPYERICKRLHFFASDVTDEAFGKILRGEAKPEDEASFRSAYLGFIVVRPLPGAIVGRTILKTYPEDKKAGRRHYPCTRSYASHLLGVDLGIRSLAFQEQDTVLAACATVALWCSFHQTGEVFETPAPRPAAITRAANVVMHHARPIPSHGLNVQQICNAIAHVGLEPEVVEVKKNTALVSLIYAHVSMGIPVLLGVRIESQGLHAITICGYSLQESRCHKQEVAGVEKSIPMMGLRIDEFYAHDDQFGPFSRLVVRPSATNSNRVYPVMFEGQWTDKSTGKLLAMAPEVVIVPVYNKIRVTFLDVQKWITRFHDLVRTQLTNAGDAEWDVHLTTTNKLKSAMRSQISVDVKIREHVLLHHHPRFIWRAVLTLSGKPLVEFFVDATDMAKSFPIYFVIWHNDPFKQAIRSLLGVQKLVQMVEGILTPRFAAFLGDTMA